MAGTVLESCIKIESIENLGKCLDCLVEYLDLDLRQYEYQMNW